MKSQARSGMALFVGICLAAVAAGNLFIFWALAQGMGEGVAAPRSSSTPGEQSPAEAAVPRRPMVLPIAPAEVTGVVPTGTPAEEVRLAAVDPDIAILPPPTVPPSGDGDVPSTTGGDLLGGELDDFRMPTSPPGVAEEPRAGNDAHERGLGHCKDTHRPKGHRDDWCDDGSSAQGGDDRQRGDGGPRGQGHCKDKHRPKGHGDDCATERSVDEKTKKNDERKQHERSRGKRDDDKRRTRRGSDDAGSKPPIFASLEASDGAGVEDTGQPADVPPSEVPAHPVVADARSSEAFTPPGQAKKGSHPGRGRALGHR